MKYSEIPTNCRTIMFNIPNIGAQYRFTDKPKFTKNELKKSFDERNINNFEPHFNDCLTLGLIIKNEDNTYSRNLNFGKKMKKDIQVTINETGLTPVIKTFPDTIKGHNESVKYLQDLYKLRGLTPTNTELSIEIQMI